MKKKSPSIAGSNLSWDIHITPATFLYSVVWAPLRGEAIILHRKALPYSSWGDYFLLAVFLEASQWEHSSFTPHCQHSKSDFSSLLPKAFCKIPRAPSEYSSLGAQGFLLSCADLFAVVLWKKKKKSKQTNIKSLRLLRLSFQPLFISRLFLCSL